MSDSKYKNLLHGEFESLGYFADEYYAVTCRYERFELLIKKIWPCIQKLSIFPEWVKQARSINRKYNQIQANLNKENKVAFKSLKEKITNKDLLNYPPIKKLISKIEKVIDSKKLSHGTYELIKTLIRCVFKLGGREIVKDYTTIRDINTHIPKIRNPSKWLQRSGFPQFYKIKSKHRYNRDWIPEIFQRPETAEMTFAPAFEKSVDMAADLFGCKIKNIFTVLYFLERADSSWDTSFDKIKAKYYKNNDSDEFIFKRADWEEINIIKNDPQRQTYHFTTQNADKCLSFILDDIILTQANNKPNISQQITGEESYKFKLRLQGLCLYLDIFRNSATTETYFLKKFGSEESEHYKIAKKIYDPEYNDKIEGGTTISRFLSEIGMGKHRNKNLGELFMPPLERDTYSIKQCYAEVHVNYNDSQKKDGSKSRTVTRSNKELIQIFKEVATLTRFNN